MRRAPRPPLGLTRPAAAFRRRHPGVEVRVREGDLTDPMCGLRAGLVDVALTRAPFDGTGLVVRELRADPVGAVLRADDPLAGREHVPVVDLPPSRVVVAWCEGDPDPLVR